MVRIRRHLGIRPDQPEYDQWPERASTQRTASKPCEGPDPGHTKGIQMTQAQERIERKAGKTVTTLAQAIAAYGGRGPFREAFCISDDQLDDWQRWGDIPRGAQLGLLLGLRARGYTMSPDATWHSPFSVVGRRASPAPLVSRHKAVRPLSG